ncbi:MAG: DEAD/DEAH box helicase [Candidatus Binatus sp.]|uniref:DEAD/DEAH box helicase n=1 Tax=Candidatus Binatus sp. TaxID=2811406 RepID=UPI0027219BBA|nr:DEAD/DEAH box helicase [Candidatus Binatus sp.]MDO8432153.1 DEAD/DEAH box helicase [Candidatus Binatus sp.]
MSFSQFSLSPEIHRSIKDRGHHTPTPVQAGTIAVALEGRDIVATAETGSGKTAAFLIPTIDRLHRKQVRHLAALVIAPTRELAAQVTREFDLVARHTHIRAATIVGGESERRQIEEIRKGAQVLVACPGRLIDYIDRGIVKLDKIEVVVIDEADRLLDMGFLPQLRKIMRMVPKNRQTMMFSATMASGPEIIAREFLSTPERVTIGGKSAPPASIRQSIYPVTLENKGPVLLEILKRPEVESAIVFTRTKSRADRVAKMLQRSNIKAVQIHGDRSQSQRNAALAGFRTRKFRVMVATDVAARGLDIAGVSHVINFDLPDETEGYIHRIGRTARMGLAGEAISLVTPEERVSLARLERTLGNSLDREHVEGFEKLEILAPKPVTVFRSSGARNRSTRNRPRSRWA